VGPTFLGASIVASFLGGMLALFAPCCISFLFPSYFASAFKQKSRIFFMTFVYFIGLTIILVPIGLGVSALSRIFSNYHEEVFLIGGLFLIFLGILTLFGKTIPLPFKLKPNFQKSDVLSVFILGLVSGAATSCCTPVLIGVLTITALSGTFFYALLLSLTYVLGMVFPLFILSYFWDKYNFSKAKWLQGKVCEWQIIGKKYYIHSSHLISAAILVLMGIFIVILALLGKTWTSAAYLAKMANIFGRMASGIINGTKFVPEYIWASLAVLLLLFVIRLALKPKGER
jgi:cytochrome c biogenesis protein CcdA